MPACRLGVIGLGRRGWFHLERLKLREDVVVAAVTDSSPELREQARKSQWPVFDTVDAVVASKPLDAVLIATPTAAHADAIPQALHAGLHIWVEPPLSLQVSQARNWLALADRCGKWLSLVPWSRWDPEFGRVLASISSGRLGNLQTVRLTLAEWTPLAGVAVDDRHELPEAQFGPHGFDQLLQLVPFDPTSIWARRFVEEDGFLAVIDFANGLRAQIDFRRRSRDSQSTGWTLEGVQGSYRRGRVVTVSPAGELIEEPVEPAAKPAFDEWRIWSDSAAGATRAAEQRRAWQTVGLIRAVTKACERGSPVFWDEIVGS